MVRAWPTHDVARIKLTSGAIPIYMTGNGYSGASILGVGVAIRP